MVGLLPGGFVDPVGIVHRAVELRPLSGREEELLVAAPRLEVASLVTMVLSRCVQRIGSISPVSEELARSLLVADRQYLLLKLREATFGDQVQASLPCPWPDCGKRIAIQFSTREIPIEESAEKAAAYRVVLSTAALGELDEEERTVTFRLPNGGDQEALTSLLAENEASALVGLLSRCLVRIGRSSAPEPETVARLSPQARVEIEGHMERLAPHVDLTMEATCAECGREFTAPFDIQRFFFGELQTTSDLLYREVHYLAYHYHWSEREILEMSRDRRRRYIEILADEIERINEAV